MTENTHATTSVATNASKILHFIATAPSVRNCVCGCGVDARSFSFVLTEQRVVRGGVDLLTPLTQGMDAHRRRELLEQIAQGKCGARVACCHVHPEYMY